MPARPTPTAAIDRIVDRHPSDCGCQPCEVARIAASLAFVGRWSLAGIAAAIALIQLHDAVTGAGGVLLMLGLR